MHSNLKIIHTAPHNTVQNMAQPVASFRTTTPSTAMTGTMTTKQVNPVHVHSDTSCKAPLGHCAHVHKSTVQVCKPGESLTLRKVKHPHNGRTSVNRLPLPKQDILTIFWLLSRGPIQISSQTRTQTCMTCTKESSNPPLI